MIDRRSFLVAGVAALAAAALPAHRSSAAEGAPVWAYVLGATAITEVFGDGQRLVAVAIEYDRPVDASVLDLGLYALEGRTIVGVYASDGPTPTGAPGKGRFVILDLARDDAAARLYSTLPGGGVMRLPAAATVAVSLPGAPPSRVPGASGPPAFGSEPLSLPTAGARNLVVDDFTSAIFEDAETGDTLAYNLFIPPDRDRLGPLPLVLFMHDAGATSTIVDTTLVQGLGAVSWARPDDQARHPAIVLAPQYSEQIVNDSSEATSMLETTLHLVDRIAEDHGVDRDRIYTTGQSGGGMMSIAMMVREPERFAAAFLVACQWDPVVVAPLARQKLWVMVSEGDAKAFPGQNAIMEVIEGAGVTVARATWDGTSTPDVFASDTAALVAEDATVNYTALKSGTVVPPDQEDSPGANHINTWRIAYGIPEIRDWIMAQRR